MTVEGPLVVYSEAGDPHRVYVQDVATDARWTVFEYRNLGGVRVAGTSLIVWSFEEDGVRRIGLDGHTEAVLFAGPGVRDVQVSADGTGVAIASRSAQMHLLDTATGAAMSADSGRGVRPPDLGCLSPDFRYAVRSRYRIGRYCEEVLLSLEHWPPYEEWIGRQLEILSAESGDVVRVVDAKEGRIIVPYSWLRDPDRMVYLELTPPVTFKYWYASTAIRDFLADWEEGQLGFWAKLAGIDEFEPTVLTLDTGEVEVLDREGWKRLREEAMGSAGDCVRHVAPGSDGRDFIACIELDAPLTLRGVTLLDSRPLNVSPEQRPEERLDARAGSVVFGEFSARYISEQGHSETDLIVGELIHRVSVSPGGNRVAILVVNVRHETRQHYRDNLVTYTLVVFALPSGDEILRESVTESSYPPTVVLGSWDAEGVALSLLEGYGDFYRVAAIASLEEGVSWGLPDGVLCPSQISPDLRHGVRYARQGAQGETNICHYEGPSVGELEVVDLRTGEVLWEGTEIVRDGRWRWEAGGELAWSLDYNFLRPERSPEGASISVLDLETGDVTIVDAAAYRQRRAD